MNGRSRGTVARWAVAATTAGMIAGNFIAATLPLAGRGTGEVSARYPVLVTPAGYVFAIWGLIYVAMAVYSGAQFLPPLRDDELPERLAPPLIVSNVANVAWLVLWHNLLIPWTLPVMLVLLGSLIAAYSIARRDRSAPPGPLESRAVLWPLSLYLGWVSVATIANTSIVLYAAGWSGWGISAEVWAVIVLAVGAALALAGLVRERDLVFAGVFVWAYVGIGAKQNAAPLVAWTAFLFAGVIALAMGAVVLWGRRGRPQATA